MLLFTSSESQDSTGGSATMLSGVLDAMDVPETCLLDNVDVDRLRERPDAVYGREFLNTVDEERTDENRPRTTKCIDEGEYK